MSKACQEQRPLLCDDNSDEEVHVRSYNYHRRNFPPVCRGRAKIHAKGAAAVLTRWPDNCSTSVTYWWLGVIMIVITLFVIYNSVLIFGMIPATNLYQPKFRNFNTGINSKPLLSLPDVYMHLITENTSGLYKHINKYLPHIDIVSKTYPSFKYTFLVVLNDTSNNIDDDHYRNEIALNSLWAHEKNNNKVSSKYNISIEYISLTRYLNDSPIKKFWRHLPSYLIEFLIRSVSVWEKGGIAINPLILTPKSPNPIYIKKLHELLYKYTNSKNKLQENKKTTKEYVGLHKKIPNNIQDIINDLSKDDYNVSDFNLNFAENYEVPSIQTPDHTIQSQLNRNTKNNSDTRLNDNISISADNKNRKKILPLFTKYLHDRPKKELSANTSNVKNPKVSKNSEIIFKDAIISKENDSRAGGTTFKKIEQINEPKENASILEMLKSTKENKPLQLLAETHDNVPDHDLSIDIQGNIIATKTACHSFLGTVFSNFIHYTEEKIVSDFIISELSLFCNGLLMSCPGVNVILI